MEGCNLLNFLRVLTICYILHAKQIDAKGRFNVSFSKLDTCREYDISNAHYVYKEFFQVHTLDNNMIAKNEHLHLKFYVLANMDAHILLSVTHHPRIKDRVYEIVIGAGGNTFSAIRTNMGQHRVATNQDANLLSTFDPTPIEIIQTKDGELLVYIPGFKTEPLLSYMDASPLSINFISFSTFGFNTARWFYDCEFDGFANEMNMEVRPQTAEQRLIATLNLKAENKSRPEYLDSVRFAIQIRSVAYQQEATIMKTRMHLILYWNDKRLQWQPEDYNNMTIIVRPTFDIWIPDIIVLNAAFESIGDLLSNYELKIQNDGNVSLLASDVEVSTWCVDAAHNWPHELLNCIINLGSNELTLEYDHTRPLSTEPVNTLSEWTLLQVVLAKIENGLSSRYTPSGILQSMIGDITIQLDIMRNSSFYRTLFTVPILACQSFIMLSFVLRGYKRGALILLVFILTAMGLMFITKHATPHYVPDLMIVYQHLMRSAIFCYMLHIAIIWLEQYPPKGKPMNWLVTLVNLSPIRFVLCMRFQDSKQYVEIQEKPWSELAKMCNNLSFIVIFLIFMWINIFVLPAV